MNHQKGFANIAIIILVIVVLAGVASYFTLVKRTPEVAQQTNTPTSTETQSPKFPTPTFTIKTPTPIPTSTTTTGNYPAWIKNIIAEVESNPTQDPRVSLTQYEYKNQIVYYLPVFHCCDFTSSLYNENGDVICWPDGGITGRGDGRCSDFFTMRQNGKVIWQDTR